jgi:hypothetical protein
VRPFRNACRHKRKPWPRTYLDDAKSFCYTLPTAICALLIRCSKFWLNRTGAVVSLSAATCFGAVGFQPVSAPVKNNGNIIVYFSPADQDRGELTLHRELNVDNMLADVKYDSTLRRFFQEVRSKDRR